MKSIDYRLRKLLGNAPRSYWEEQMSSRPGYWGERALSQLVYAYALSKVNDHAFDDAIRTALDGLESRIAEEGAIAKQTALEVEQRLNSLAETAKSYDVICVAHAHIDMNWMWSWDETVAITLDTFRTMLQLMEEYPRFTFSQSQAAIYRIVEQYAPDMLQEIKQRVKEGRWEVTASHWVEADKNMPNGESLARHILYTKKYLSALLDIAPDMLQLDYEPDTFGHSLNVPEILNQGGVKYYYHCRGGDQEVLYRWLAPSGQSVIVYREPTWYNDSVRPILGSYVPEICRTTGLNAFLHVYGVGDHGGGPTRRDLERMQDMNDWPIYPNLRFGTYAEYFRLAEQIEDKLPIVRGEQNFVFTGCYSSQTRIKRANRIGEATLHEAEIFSSFAAAAANARYPGIAYEEAWRNVLFNQFHDILPGSGVIETREHALGLFQHTMAIANTNRKLALEAIAAKIDTSGLEVDLADQTSSEGAGVGFGIQDFRIAQVERGRGLARIVHLFNPAAADREEVAELVLWDWKSPVEALEVTDERGVATEYQLLDQGCHPYWGHDYVRLLIRAKVPSCGYSTYRIAAGEEALKPLFTSDPRLDRPEMFVLENDRMKVAFHPENASIVSMVVKSTGEELVADGRPAGIFRLIEEDPAQGMSAWRVGRYMKVRDLHDAAVKIRWLSNGSLRQSLQYELAFSRSSCQVTVSLDHGSDRLEFQVTCDWQESGSNDTHIPQLNFHWPLAYSCSSYQYDVPHGTIDREPLAMDVPANSWAHAPREGGDGCSVMLMSQTKYGFRGVDQSLSLTLIRGSFDPDPYPELGDHHRMKFAVGWTRASNASQRIDMAHRYNHPISVLSGTAHPGTLPLSNSFLKLVEGTVSVSAVKMPETNRGNRWIVRVYETEGQATVARLALFGKVRQAYYVDTNEVKAARQHGVIAISGHLVSFDVPAYASTAVCLELEDESSQE